MELSEGEKLKGGIQKTDKADELMQEAQNLAEDSGIRSKSIIKISHRISRGIYDTYIEENCNFIIMDRDKRSNFFERYFSSVIDSVLQKSTTEVAILHGRLKPGKVQNILIPYSSDIHTQLAAEIMPALKDYFEADIKFGIVFNPDTSLEEQQKKIDQVTAVLSDNNMDAKIETAVDADILQGIIKLSLNSDLMVMGGKTGDFIELLFAKSIVREITEQVDCPVLWLKEYEERESFFLSLFKSQKN